jgi:serine protease Do
VKKFVIGTVLVLIGFLLGGLAFYGMDGYSVLFPRRAAVAPQTALDMNKTASAFSGIVKSVSPSVVNISSSRRKGDIGDVNELLDEFFSPGDFEGRRAEQSQGSGVIVSEDGYIITNYHVVGNSEDITVTLFDRRSFKGRMVGSDPKTDLAILRVPVSGLPVAPWGDSDTLNVGEFVLAIGNPYSLSHTVTMGIISAVGRANVGIADYEDFIQTDAAINPGNSGGPLVNARGEIIGINTAIFSRSGGYQGIGFAVPANMARLIVDQLVKEGRVVRGWLGVTIQELSPEVGRKFGLSAPSGALISDTAKGSPAQKAGIRRGDIITGFGGKAVLDPSGLKNMVARSRPGSRVDVKLMRDMRPISLSVDVGEYPVETSQAAPQTLTREARRGSSEEGAFFAGLLVAELTKDVSRQLGLAPDERGVVVVAVDEDSPSHEAGLKRGDLIEEIERKPVRSLADFNRAASAPPGDEVVLVLANRMGRRLYVPLRKAVSE